jgi:hypothetical protein
VELIVQPDRKDVVGEMGVSKVDLVQKPGTAFVWDITLPHIREPGGDAAYDLLLRAAGKTARLRYVSRDPPRFVIANLSSPQLFFEVLDGHSVDNRVIVANHRQRTGQRTFGHRWLRDELRR